VAAAKNILIYGPSMSAAGAGVDNEQTLAAAAGHTVAVADATTWSGMTTAQFAAFDAIVFGDPTCRTDPATVLGLFGDSCGSFQSSSVT
jgi:hypothetical protein